MRILVVVAALAALAGCTRPPGPNDPSLKLPTKTPNAASLLFVGDLSVARGIADSIDKDGGGDTAFPFARIKPVLDAHDLVFGNLECVVTDSTEEEATQKTWRIRAPTKYLSNLHEAGIDVVSVANNHALDFGAQGFNSTLAQVEKEGVLPVGSLKDPGWRENATIVDVGGIRVGFLAYNQHGDEYKHEDYRPTPARYRIGDVVDDIKAARPKVDFLVVSVHGGLELDHNATEWQVKDSRKAIDAGADLWVGHHPHVAQPFTVYKGKVIAYSLGDFLFDKSSPWLVHRNNPRLMLEMNLAKGADGKVTAQHKFIAGDQEPKTFRPFENDASFDVDSFAEPAADAPTTFKDLLKSAKVERTRKDKTGVDVAAPCDRWETRRVPTKGHAFRWLVPRWGCGKDLESDGKRGWETVAPTAEMFKGSLKRGIWAHPNADGVLRLRFPGIKLGSKLSGFAGVPDWGVEMQKQQMAAGRPAWPAFNVRVVVEGKDAKPVDVSTAVAFDNAVTALAVDTAALKGEERDVVVEVSGGSGDAESRFVFDLQVMP